MFVGIGQSLGGFITMIQQGKLWDRFYAWVAVLVCLPTVAYPE